MHRIIIVEFNAPDKLPQKAADILRIYDKKRRLFGVRLQPDVIKKNRFRPNCRNLRCQFSDHALISHAQPDLKC